MTNEYSKYEYTIKHGISGSGEDAKYEYTVKFKGQYFYTLINGGELSFRLPSECEILDPEEFLYCDYVAIQLMPENNSSDTAYAIISMRHLHAFIDGFLRIILDDDLEFIVRWFIEDGRDRLSYQSAEEILIECIDPDKCEEENVSNKKLKMLEQLKSELSNYTRNFKKALLKEWPYSYESDLENICSVIKEIMEDYIQYDELDKHPKYKIPTFKYDGRMHTSLDNSDCICWDD